MKTEKATLMIGDALKRIREERCMTQEELALKADSNVNFISGVETGRKGVSFATVEVFAKALRVPASFLVLLADSSKDQRVIDLKKMVLESLAKGRNEKRSTARDVQLV